MDLISTSWTCQQCGATCTCDPPERCVCNQCIADLQAPARAQLPQTASCPSCGGPVCPDCGDAMVTVLITIPAAAPASITDQAAQLIAGYRAHRQEATGDDT